VNSVGSIMTLNVGERPLIPMNGSDLDSLFDTGDSGIDRVHICPEVLAIGP
jgi:hypothetical protein